MNTSLRRGRGFAAAALFSGITALLVGCSAAQPALQPAESALPTPFAHIHALTVDEISGDLVAATHEGIFDLIIASDGAATFSGPRAGLDFDPMSFVAAGDTLYASGHPGPTTPDSFGSPNLGLIVSADDGATWTNVSLTGQTDFHALAVGPTAGAVEAAHIYGIDSSKTAIQRSSDGGMTWADGAELVARDILADPTTPGKVYATTEAGVAVSEDDAVSFQIDPAAPPLYLVGVDAATQQLVGVDTGGNLWRDTDGAWGRGGAVMGVAQSFASHDGRVYVAGESGISFTDDDGATWTVLTFTT